MIRKNALALLVLLGVTASFGHNLRYETNEKGQKVMTATYGDIDGEPNDSGELPETFKPKYTEFSSSSEEQDASEENAGKTYKPKYKKPSPMEAVDVSVTKDFCAQVLEDIKEKKAPYYIEEKFTGEMREDLVAQCGASICSWGKQYREAVQDCGACPAECGDSFDPAAFFKGLLKDESSAKPIMEAILRIGKGGGDDGKTIKLQIKTGEEEEESAEEEIEASEAATGSAAPGEEGYPEESESADDKPAVTRQFCLKVIRDIKGKRAPYYVEGSFTEEARADLVDQCGEIVCGWSASFAELLSERNSCDQESSGEYLEGLMKNEKGIEEIEMYAEADAGDEE